MIQSLLSEATCMRGGRNPCQRLHRARVEGLPEFVALVALQRNLNLNLTRPRLGPAALAFLRGLPSVEIVCNSPADLRSAWSSRKKPDTSCTIS